MKLNPEEITLKTEDFKPKIQLNETEAMENYLWDLILWTALKTEA